MKILLLLLFPLLLQAQTRGYLTQNIPAVVATVNSNWDVTTGYASYLLNNYIDNTAVTFTTGTAGAAAVRKMLGTQFITPPLIGQTINGTLTGQARCNFTGSGTHQGLIYLRVINPNGSIASEVGNTLTTNLTGTNTNRSFSLSISGLFITAGQRLCIEIGDNYSVGSATTPTFKYNIRATINNDLPVDNTSTAGTLNPWFEFSQKLMFQKQSNFFF